MCINKPVIFFATPILGELVPLGLIAGINGMLIGNYLTADQDLSTICNLGLEAAH
ncbi:MAG: hypothetical protein AB9917_00815 [Negativicutes bacterium]